ncbi:MAG: FapA family protein [Oscillospiraceae bacterium]|nr:FapA family protein [Oscillospiraceae bacterium]
MNHDNQTTEVIDSSVTIEISEDRMNVYLILSAPGQGGRDAAPDEVMAAVKDNGIVVEVNQAAIAGAIAEKTYGHRVLIARGIAPVNGIDGAVSYKFECSGVLSAKTNERDEMDYKDLGLVKNILTGTVIAEIILPTEGTEGSDVCGNTHLAMPGKDPKYLIGKGTSLNEDGTAIVAETDGNLHWHRDHFTVEEVLIIAEDIGATTGNVDFIGDVLVKGNVLEGFTVKSKKSITVNGTANNAILEADGNIEIKLGCVNSTLTTKNGGIKVGFCENSTIDCGGDLTSASFVACDIFCHGTTYAITGKGIMIGGKMTCLKGMIFNTVGSESYTKTRLTLGNGAILMEEKFELEKEEAKLTEQIGKLIQIIDMLNALKKNKGSLPTESEDMLSTAIRTRFKNSNDIKKINKRISEIENSFLDNANLNVEIRKTIWPGVSVKIGALQKKIDIKQDRCRISIDGSGDIGIHPIVGSI